MTIGPEPTMQMVSMSVLFGNFSNPGVDEGVRVVRSRPRFRMELDRACARLGEAQTFHRLVVERDVRRVALVLRAYGEAVVLARHEHAAARALEHRMVDPAVTERELERLVAGGLRDQLMSEADPEDVGAPEQGAHRPRLGDERCRVARARREEHALV